jgi:hypothetical protein
VLPRVAQHPLAHSLFAAHFAAHDTPVTVDVTQTVPGQQLFASAAQLWPADAHTGAQLLAGTHMAAVPATVALQHPLMH